MRSLSILIVVSCLCGCSPYRSSFDCPMADNKDSCKRVSKIATEVESDLKAQHQDKTIVHFVRI